MYLKRAIDRVPGGLMVLPLVFGAALNTLDQMHLAWIEAGLKAFGVPKLANGHYEFLRLGGFSEALFKNGAKPLIALFLLCIGAQINLHIGARAAKKGVLLLVSKYAAGLAVGMLGAAIFGRFGLPLGLTTMTVIAAMTNSNGGMYVALMRQYGNRSDVAAVAIVLLNDGPFLTLLSLGLMGDELPIYVFLSVLLPILIGAILGNLDRDMQAFLKSGELMLIPFFAFALGANMNLAVFLKYDVLLAGLALGLLTTFVTGAAGILALKLFREPSTTAAWAEASTAGNAVMTPTAVAEAAKIAGLATATQYEAIRNTATAQVSISTLTTAVLCPLMVILWHKWQMARGIDGRDEAPGQPKAEAEPVEVALTEAE